MCGIIGYVGNKEALPILIDGLKKLEYRGYDSTGITIRNKNDNPIVVKSNGKIDNLISKTNKLVINGNIGMGHTRWATHGKPSLYNAHPHHSDDYNVIGCHNGIIENFQELKEKLLNNGYSFYSETDSEVLIKLIDYYCKKYKHGPIDAINKTVVRARGSYAITIMFKDYPNQIWFAKKGSPLVIAKTTDGYCIASDINALSNCGKSFYFVDDYECGYISNDEIYFYDLNGDVIDKKPISLVVDDLAISKGNYPHYMIKEIEEQPTVINNTINKYVDIDNNINLGIDDEELKEIEEIYIYGCGSAYHAGVTAGYIFEELTKINARVDISSEFRYRNYKLNPKSIAIVISQSGETKDSYEALNKLNSLGIKTLSIVNTKKSIISKEAKYNIYTEAGPEISVATTKAYSCQLIILYLLAIKIAKLKNVISDKEYAEYINEIRKIPEKINYILKHKEQVQKLSNILGSKHDVFFIGRGLDYSTCMEASLKLKEVTYIHSEAYPAGELKHGTISLIHNDVSVIAITTNKKLHEKIVSNMIEIKSRDGSVIALTPNDFNVDDCSKYQLYIPETVEYFTASLAIIPLQLLAYYISVARGIDPDKPRNLAKSVTVE